ncbi:rhodanese [Sphingomonas sp. SUN019]|uniref:rhodanese-like domain-containing protein n=1 Tax=Sphingomonas sp. SUN019 TaxID=2937788 RepID=UPI002164D7D9|nr:rhodanese-like domain-containing protein [Sphingomonas sp. SUN019]UVO49282.1 rhodanese [Sphingomonas sp. SUN019]
MRAVGIAIIGLALATLAPGVDEVFDPATGYRIAQYRGVVPAAPPGVPRVDARAVADLVDRGDAILIDVVPAEGGVRDPATGDWRLARSAVSIPGATWFPEAGRGQPDPAIARGFADGVARLRRDHPSGAIVVFCLSDCWMGWNAAWRLSRAGYRRVLWFADGADGWRDIGRPLVPVIPYAARSKSKVYP